MRTLAGTAAGLVRPAALRLGRGRRIRACESMGRGATAARSRPRAPEGPGGAPCPEAEGGSKGPAQAEAGQDEAPQLPGMASRIAQERRQQSRALRRGQALARPEKRIK